ncbi:hypothetical protein A8C56_05120 [Niabella ginsenosidivorans]|uniref:K1 capsule-specific polysaccharide lyase C-terminal domain-containing protein n=1 Tax=Niabella ginsenosidivorans TaxID=1176587 RepID=A0A1A9I1L7_9BACT|nr:hypothetical protein A8C56_05120 [Niabella ginsenosidivorans]
MPEVGKELYIESINANNEVATVGFKTPGINVAGQATLVNGSAEVPYNIDQATQMVIVSYESINGTPGVLYCSEADYIVSGGFIIKSTSTADNSTVNYLVVLKPVIEKLATPVITLNSKSDTTADLSITTIPNATNYIWYKDAVQVQSSSGTTLSLTGLTAATIYNITCKAQASGYTDSDLGQYNLQTNAEQNRVFTLTAENSQIQFDGDDFYDNGIKIILQDNDVLLIPAGSYTYIDLENIVLPEGQRVYIRNSGGVVELTGLSTLEMSNINGVTISGDGALGTEYGFWFHDNSYRAMYFSGSNLTIANMKFENIGDYTIYYNDKDKIYDPSDSSTWSENVKFSNLYFDNTGSLQADGGFPETSNESHTGIKKNWEVSYCTFINADWGALVYIGSVEDVDIHHIIFNNINATNNNHNGIIFVKGNGKVHHCKCTNHQGNMVRFWNFNFTSNANKIAEVFHNKIYHSRKYSGMEISPQPYMFESPYFYPTNAKVYNNTVGDMNYENNDFPGRLVDFYNLHGTFEFYNNLGFELDDDTLINYASGTSDADMTVNSNNVYKTTAAEAVNNTTDLNSIITGVGAEDW